MTRESKLALIIGFVLVLVVGVLVSDHFSQANTMALDVVKPSRNATDGSTIELGDRERAGISGATGTQGRELAVRGPVEIPSNLAGRTKSILDDAFEKIKNTEFHPTAEFESDQMNAVDSKPVRPLPEKKYSTYKVVKNDSLIKIAREMLGNGDRWHEIHELNAAVLGPDAILKIGVYLRLPGDARVGTTQANNQVKDTRSTGLATTYTVVSGDILGQISMRLLGTSRRANEIAELNGLESPNDIRVGMKLKIPAK